MLDRILFANVALAISTAVIAAAEEPGKPEDCPFGLDKIEDLIRQALSCRRGVAVFETCEWGTSGDVSLSQRAA